MEKMPSTGRRKRQALSRRWSLCSLFWIRITYWTGYVLNAAMKEYFLILDDAFAVDCVQAFDGSIQLARYIGVSENDILNTIKDIDDYFLS